MNYSPDLNNFCRFYEEFEEQQIVETLLKIQNLLNQPFQIKQKLSELNSIFRNSHYLILLLRKCIRICAEKYNVHENSEIIPAFYPNKNDYFDFLLYKTSTLQYHDCFALLNHLYVEVIHIDNDSLSLTKISNTGKYTIYIWTRGEEYSTIYTIEETLLQDATIDEAYSIISFMQSQDSESELRQQYKEAEEMKKIAQKDNKNAKIMLATVLSDLYPGMTINEVTTKTFCNL